MPEKKPKESLREYLATRVKPTIAQAIKAIAQAERRTTSAMAEILLEEAISLRNAAADPDPAKRKGKKG